MAKLSARGRIELARVSKEKTMPAIVPCSSCNGTGKYPEFLDAQVRHHKAGET